MEKRTYFDLRALENGSIKEIIAYPNNKISLFIIDLNMSIY